MVWHGGTRRRRLDRRLEAAVAVGRQDRHVTSARSVVTAWRSGSRRSSSPPAWSAINRPMAGKRSDSKDPGKLFRFSGTAPARFRPRFRMGHLLVLTAVREKSSTASRASLKVFSACFRCCSAKSRLRLPSPNLRLVQRVLPPAVGLTAANSPATAEHADSLGSNQGSPLRSSASSAFSERTNRRPPDTTGTVKVSVPLSKTWQRLTSEYSAGFGLASTS